MNLFVSCFHSFIEDTKPLITDVAGLHRQTVHLPALQAFHEHGGELVCGAIVSVRSGAEIQVNFFQEALGNRFCIFHQVAFQEPSK